MPPKGPISATPSAPRSLPDGARGACNPSDGSQAPRGDFRGTGRIMIVRPPDSIPITEAVANRLLMVRLCNRV
jgi:hypothetical protein